MCRIRDVILELTINISNFTHVCNIYILCIIIYNKCRYIHLIQLILIINKALATITQIYLDWVITKN